MCALHFGPDRGRGFGGTRSGFARYLGADGVVNGRRSVQGRHRQAREAPCTTEPQQNDPQPDQNESIPGFELPFLGLERSPVTLHVHPFVGRCFPLSAPPRFQPLPLRDASRRARKRGCPPPPFGRVTSRTRQSGEDTPPPPSLHFGGEGSEIRAGNVRAGVLGGRCLRGRFGREILAGDAPSRTGCCCHSAPSIRPAEIVTARCSLNGEW